MQQRLCEMRDLYICTVSMWPHDRQRSRHHQNINASSHSMSHADYATGRIVLIISPLVDAVDNESSSEEGKSMVLFLFSWCSDLYFESTARSGSATSAT
mmetsp:Transcript_823/g.2825  ORF Transcript_823/g.2825 Transcript_823/m.2825 type:complete len:99 (-) Transcript_823:665-961(-)